MGQYSKRSLAILAMLADGPVARERVIDEVGQLIPPAEAYRDHVNTVENLRLRRSYGVNLQNPNRSHLYEWTDEEHVRLGRRHMVLEDVKRLVMKNKAPVIRTRVNGSDALALRSYTHPNDEAQTGNPAAPDGG